LTDGPQRRQERGRGKTRTVTLELTVGRLVSHSVTVSSSQGNTLGRNVENHSLDDTALQPQLKMWR